MAIVRRSEIPGIDLIPSINFPEINTFRLISGIGIAVLGSGISVAPAAPLQARLIGAAAGIGGVFLAASSIGGGGSGPLEPQVKEIKIGYALRS